MRETSNQTSRKKSTQLESERKKIERASKEHRGKKGKDENRATWLKLTRD